MFIRSLNIDTFLFHKYDLFKEACTMSDLEPRLTTGRICKKSPPKQVVILPKEFVFPKISLKLRSAASKACLWVIGASSQIINFVLFNNSLKFEFFLILQTAISSNLMGILRRECAVRPPTNKSAAIPEEAYLDFKKVKFLGELSYYIFIMEILAFTNSS